MDSLILAGHTDRLERFAIYPSGRVRWLGPAEYAHYLAQSVTEISTTQQDEYDRWVAQSQTLRLTLL